ncbi:unnamed protein product, partial [Staurois parvus]
MYIHTDTCTYLHRHMYTQTHVHTYTHVHTHIHAGICIDTHMYIHTDTHTHLYKKLQYFVVHSQSRVLHSRGRQRTQHKLLPLLSLRSAIEQSDGSQCQRQCLSSKPAQQDGPGDTLTPTIISTRHWQAGEWKFQGLV